MNVRLKRAQMFVRISRGYTSIPAANEQHCVNLYTVVDFMPLHNKYRVSIKWPKHGDVHIIWDAADWDLSRDGWITFYSKTSETWLDVQCGIMDVIGDNIWITY